jgi:hypothetical protein
VAEAWAGWARRRARGVTPLAYPPSRFAGQLFKNRAPPCEAGRTFIGARLHARAGQSFKQRTFVRGAGARSGARDGTVLSEYEVRRGKMNLQLIANEENQDRAQCERSACERYGIFQQLNGELGLK